MRYGLWVFAAKYLPKLALNLYNVANVYLYSIEINEINTFFKYQMYVYYPQRETYFHLITFTLLN